MEKEIYNYIPPGCWENRAIVGRIWHEKSYNPCAGHERNLAAMRGQVEAEGPETLATFNARMSNDAVAAEEIIAFSRDNPIDVLFRRKTLVDWSAFKRRHGARKGTRDEDRAKPYSQTAFFGLDAPRSWG